MYGCIMHVYIAHARQRMTVYVCIDYRRRAASTSLRCAVKIMLSYNFIFGPDSEDFSPLCRVGCSSCLILYALMVED